MIRKGLEQMPYQQTVHLSKTLSSSEDVDNGSLAFKYYVKGFSYFPRFLALFNLIINPQFSSLIPFLLCLEHSKITSLKIAGKWLQRIVSTTRGHLQRKEPGFFKPAIRLKRQKKKQTKISMTKN